MKKSVWAKFVYTDSNGRCYQACYYNLDVIITVDYCVKSLRSNQFRIWTSSILKEYMKKGFAMNDELLKIMVEEFILMNCWSVFVILENTYVYG